MKKKQILEIEPGMVVVMITAHGNIERAVKAIQMGAADFIPKPFEAANLDHVVETMPPMDADAIEDATTDIQAALPGVTPEPGLEKISRTRV